ncbi:permease-like cell division protein FtsX [Smaragdicoccus niigatensis]|uniref:permease-like cell division protein FtsX n=1 Tax=Smaragdicoccus niigatensis TaxID=359359 RepID=UPI00035D1D69|nr:permease-like cell division protein FtsX [Smaragdicoccus niigatensis]
MGFVLSETRRGLRRNVTMTIAMILTTAISLAMLGGGLLVVKMAEKSKNMFLDRLQTQVFITPELTQFDPTCNQEVCVQLWKDLANVKGVLDVDFMSQDATLEDARKRVFEGQPEFVDLISKDALPASFMVKMKDTDVVPGIASVVNGRRGVQSMLNQSTVIDQLTQLFTGMQRAAFAVAIVQAVAALLLIANMVQVAAFSRKTEVGIMRLVGASRWYTQLPFVLEATCAAIAGLVLAIGGLFVARPLVLDVVFRVVFGVNNFAKVSNGDILTISPVLAVAGVGFAAAVSYVTLRMYVRE